MQFQANPALILGALADYFRRKAEVPQNKCNTRKIMLEIRTRRDAIIFAGC
jgi:hypothetical protein